MLRKTQVTVRPIGDPNISSNCPTVISVHQSFDCQYWQLDASFVEFFGFLTDLFRRTVHYSLGSRNQKKKTKQSWWPLAKLYQIFLSGTYRTMSKTSEISFFKFPRFSVVSKITICIFFPLPNYSLEHEYINNTE